MADIYSEKRVREIVREEIREQGIAIKEQGRAIKKLEKKLDSGFKEQGNLLGKLDSGLKEQGILLEKLDLDLTKVTELLSKELEVKSQVSRHERRLKDLETDNKLVKLTVTAHSKQLNTLTGEGA